MATATNIDSVTTGDAVPTTAPHKISTQAGRDSASVAFTPSAAPQHIYPSATLHPSPSTPQPGAGLFPGSTTQPKAGLWTEAVRRVTAYVIRAGGASSDTGTWLTGRGAICGAFTCGDGTMVDDWAGVPAGSQLVDTVTYAELAPAADGDQTINVYSYAGDEGWG